jgi:hypothetical protein
VAPRFRREALPGGVCWLCGPPWPCDDRNPVGGVDMKLHDQKCETYGCRTIFSTIRGVYCEACRKKQQSKGGRKREGCKSPGSGHYPRPDREGKIMVAAEAVCPGCQIHHPTQVRRIPDRTIREYCRNCALKAAAIDDYDFQPLAVRHGGGMRTCL